MHQDKKKPNGLAFFGAILARFWRDSLELWYNYLKMYSPKYTISDKILNSISEIEAIRSKISDSHILPTREAEMRYRATVEAAHSSTSIEGNPLNIKQVGVVLSGEPLLSRNEYAEIEVKNYKDALDYISKYDQKKITASTILKIHSLLTNRLLDASRSGKWRKNPVYIENQAGETIYTAVAPQDIPDKINDLLSWLRDNIVRVHPVIVAAILHQELVTIHPFADGNGRIGRLWHTRLLMEWDPLFAWLPVESIIHDRQQEYYDAINRSNLAGASTVFIEFMLSAIRTALREASGIKDKPLGKNAQNAALRRRFVEEFLSAHPLIHNGDLCDGLGVSPATANRILRELCEDGMLERVRDGKVWGYKAAKI